MTGENIATFGIYPHRANCEYAVSAFKVAGFRDADISIVLRENSVTDPLGSGRASAVSEDSAAGLDSGADAGGAFGWLMPAGAISVPGLGSILVTGPIVTALTGLGVDDISSGIAGALVRLGMPEHQANTYQRRIERGSILLSVYCDSQNGAQKAKGLLSATGAENISSTRETLANYDDTGRSVP